MTRKKLSLPDLRFAKDDSADAFLRKLNQLMGHVRALTQEQNRHIQILEDGEVDQVLGKVSGRDYDTAWVDQTGGGGGGSDADGANLGEGDGEVFKLTLEGVLQFRTLASGDNITITQDGEEITITATSSIGVDWDDITNKPSTFPPSAHSHAASAITFNPSGTGLVATNVQDAIEELDAASGGGSYTDEEAQDAVGGILTSSMTVTLTYDDGTPSITADVNEANLVIDWSQLDNVPGILDDIVTLGDPNADRIMFWDDSSGSVEWLTVGTNLSITGTTLNASGGGFSGLAGSAVVAGSAATSLTISGLDLSTDKAYMIDLSILNATSTDTDLDMFMNADTTRSNYDHQLFIGDGGTPFTTRANTPRIMALGPAVGVLSTITIFLSLQADGGVAANIKGGRWRSGTGMVIWDTAWRWRTTGTNVTSITFTSVTANAIDVNSVARVYRHS